MLAKAHRHYAGIKTFGVRPNFFARRTNLRASNDAMLAHFMLA